MWKTVCALVLAATIAVTAQSSPFNGTWVADVPSPGGRPVRFVITLLVDGEKVTGTLKIGTAEAVAIEAGRLRGDVLGFHRTLAEDGSRVQFLARVMDDGLRVGFMQRASADAPRASGAAEVVNFTAKRADPPSRRR